MAKDPKAPRGIAEAPCGFCRAKPLDEEGAQSLVLAVSGVDGLEEEASEVCYPFWYSDRHTATMSYYYPVVKAKRHHSVLFLENYGFRDNSGWPRRIYDKAAVNYDIVEFALKVHRNNNIKTPKPTNYRALSRSSR